MATQRSRRTAPQNSSQHLYSVRDLTTTLALSRHTLLYYEDAGIVTPARDEATGYRLYRPDDIFRLMSAILLKNVGIPPCGLAEYLSGDPFSTEHLAEYRASIERRIEYCMAQRACMDDLEELVQKVGTIEERYVQPYYVSYDRAETGYHDFPEAEGLASLLHNMPLGGLGSCFSDAVQPGGSHKPESDNAPAVGDAPVGAGFAGGIKWCRTVPVRFAHLIPGLPDHLEVVGGTRCVCLTTFNEDIFAPNSGAEAERVARYLAERSLEVAGRAFCPISLPSDHGFYMLFCVPVR